MLVWRGLGQSRVSEFLISSVEQSIFFLLHTFSSSCVWHRNEGIRSYSWPDSFPLLWKCPFVLVCRSPLALFHFKIQLPQIKPQSALQLLYIAFSVLNLQSSVFFVLQHSSCLGQNPLSWVECWSVLWNKPEDGNWCSNQELHSAPCGWGWRVPLIHHIHAGLGFKNVQPALSVTWAVSELRFQHRHWVSENLSNTCHLLSYQP